MATNFTSYSILVQSDTLIMLIYNINAGFLMGVISMFGLLSNIINICVFVQQGFRDKFNISLLALAVSDIGTLLSSLIYSVCSSPLLGSASLPVDLFEVQNWIGGFPRGTFSRITNCVTTYITFERCICVVFPIKVKGLITARVTVVTLVFIYLVMASTIIPPYLGLVVTWRFDSFSNRTILSMPFETNDGYAYIIAIANVHSFIQLVTYALIIACTIVLAEELRKQSKWRLKAAQSNDISSKVARKKVNKTIRMIASMAVIYIVCYSTSVFQLVFCAVVPDYPWTMYAMYWIVFSFAILMESVNSSVGIFLYYTMSAKFRITFIRTFLACSQSMKSAISN
ncbi:G-protein coupled receptor 139 [Biomphalaria glabrata]|nr:putative G-protein coupled receptor 139 [Biomphalaria glabrata]